MWREPPGQELGPSFEGCNQPSTGQATRGCIFQTHCAPVFRVPKIDFDQEWKDTQTQNDYHDGYHSALETGGMAYPGEWKPHIEVPEFVRSQRESGKSEQDSQLWFPQERIAKAV